MPEHLHPLPTVSKLDAGKDASLEIGISSAIPETPANLTQYEQAIWSHVTASLLEYGLIHLTDGILLAVICRTFRRWVETEEKLDALVEEGVDVYGVATPNGYVQPHQLFYLASRLKKELLQWLPEAALTIPSFAKVVGERATPPQGDLFEDPVEAHRRRKGIIGMRQA